MKEGSSHLALFRDVGTGRSSLLCGALPQAKRHGSESRHHFCVAYRRARHRLARVPSLTQSAPMAPTKNHCVPRMSPYDMPACETHVGRTQCMSLSAADDWERSCGRMREHARYTSMDVRHACDERRQESQTGRACRAPPTRRSCWTSPRSMTGWLGHGPLGSPGGGYSYGWLVRWPFNVHMAHLLAQRGNDPSALLKLLAHGQSRTLDSILL